MLVFHNPPDAVATYHTLRLCGSTATSAMRPDEKTPEMFRTGKPAHQFGGELRRSALLSDEQSDREDGQGYGKKGSAFHVCTSALVYREVR